MSSIQSKIYSFTAVSDAINKSLVLKDHRSIQDIIRLAPDALLVVRNSKNPLLAAVDQYLGNARHINEMAKRHAIEQVYDSLRIILHDFKQRCQNDSDVHKLVNHIGHTDCTQSGATLKDIIERYADIYPSEWQESPDYKPLNDLFERYRCLRAKTVAHEKIPQGELKGLRI